MTLTGTIESLKKLEVNLPDIAEESVRETKESYLDEQAQQAAMGLNKDQTSISLDGSGYSPLTIRYKKDLGIGLGAVTDRVTMYMTGESYRTMDMTVDGNDINVFFTTPQAAKLRERTTDAPWGIGGEYRTDYLGVLLSEVKRVITDKTKLQFV